MTDKEVVILIVEDDSMLRKTLFRMFKAKVPHAKIHFATTCAEGRTFFLEHCRTLRFVILDGSLRPCTKPNDPPDTLEIARLISQTPEFKGEAIAFSSYPDQNEELKRNGCHHHVEMKIGVIDFVIKCLQT